MMSKREQATYHWHRRWRPEFNRATSYELPRCDKNPRANRSQKNWWWRTVFFKSKWFWILKTKETLPIWDKEKYYPMWCGPLENFNLMWS
jgi:hypothetical protein